MKVRFQTCWSMSGDAWLDQVLETVDQVHGSKRQALLSNVAWAKDQIRIVKKYLRICKKLEKFSADILQLPVHLVDFAFPVSLMPRTRLNIQEGVCQSLELFCKDVQLHTVTLHPERLGLSDRDCVVEIVKETSAKLWDALASMPDGFEAAKTSLLTFLEQTRVDQVDNERAKLAKRHHLITELRVALAKFSEHAPKKAPTAKRGRHALLTKRLVCGLHRRGCCGAFRVLVTSVDHEWSEEDAVHVRAIDNVFNATKRGLDTDALGEDNCLDVFIALISTCDVILQIAKDECARLQWMRQQPSSSSCWNSICLCQEGLPLVAPRHLDLFARGPVGLKASPCSSAGYEQASVRFVSIMHALIEFGHLALNQMSSNYANSVAVLEFSKYEAAILQIEAEALLPLGEEVGVPYTSSVPTLELALLEQQQ